MDNLFIILMGFILYWPKGSLVVILKELLFVIIKGSLVCHTKLAISLLSYISHWIVNLKGPFVYHSYGRFYINLKGHSLTCVNDFCLSWCKDPTTGLSWWNGHLFVMMKGPLVCHDERATCLLWWKDHLFVMM